MMPQPTQTPSSSLTVFCTDKGFRVSHQIRLIGVEMVNFSSPTTPDKGLKPLAPTISQRKNQGFGYLMIVSKPLASETIEINTDPVIKNPINA